MSRRHALGIAGLCLGMAAIYSAQAQSDSVAIENPFRGVMQDRSARSDDEVLYVEKCSMCHRRMGMGTVLLGRRVPANEAELEDRRKLPAAYFKLAARQGIGNMPRISRAAPTTFTRVTAHTSPTSPPKAGRGGRDPSTSTPPSFAATRVSSRSISISVAGRPATSRSRNSRRLAPAPKCSR